MLVTVALCVAITKQHKNFVASLELRANRQEVEQRKRIIYCSGYQRVQQ